MGGYDSAANTGFRCGATPYPRRRHEIFDTEAEADKARSEGKKAVSVEQLTALSGLTPEKANERYSVLETASMLDWKQPYQRLLERLEVSDLTPEQIQWVFDDILNDGSMQARYDQRINRGIIIDGRWVYGRELGNAIEKLMSGKQIKIYPVFNDLRLQRNDASGLECPIGFNSYLVGCLSANNITIYRSFDEALETFKKDFNLK